MIEDASVEWSEDISPFHKVAQIRRHHTEGRDAWHRDRRRLVALANAGIVIDYSTTSFFCRKVRDEIREIESGVYLGKVWWGKTRILDFALTEKA